MIDFVVSVLRISAPLILAAQAGLLSEKSGVVQIGLEGMMLVGALIGSIVALTLGETFHLSSAAPWLGFFVAGFAGMAISAIYGFFTIERKSNSIVVGTALNIFAAGICPFITKAVFATTGSTPSLPIERRWGLEPVLITLLAVVFLQFLLQRTRWGLQLRFAGENSEVLRSLGQSPRRIRWSAILSCGYLAGGAGSFLSLAMASNYSPGMTGGRGFMALAALICGKWRPVPTALMALLFATMEALQVHVQTSGSVGNFVQILPYFVTIVALAGFFGQSRPPRELT